MVWIYNIVATEMIFPDRTWVKRFIKNELFQTKLISSYSTAVLEVRGEAVHVLSLSISTLSDATFS